MSTIRDALDTLAEKVGAGADASNAFTIADKIDAITAAVSTPSNSNDIAEAVEKFGDAMPTYEAEYDLLTAEPDDWETKYYNYFYKDGSDYLAVTKVPEYDVTTEEPADWATNYTDYYTKDGSVYTPVTGETAPTWEASTYYAKSMVVPTFTTNTYYKKDSWQ